MCRTANFHSLEISTAFVFGAQHPRKGPAQPRGDNGLPARVGVRWNPPTRITCCRASGVQVSGAGLRGSVALLFIHRELESLG